MVSRSPSGPTEEFALLNYNRGRVRVTQEARCLILSAGLGVDALDEELAVLGGKPDVAVLLHEQAQVAAAGQDDAAEVGRLHDRVDEHVGLDVHAPPLWIARHGGRVARHRADGVEREWAEGEVDQAIARGDLLRHLGRQRAVAAAVVPGGVEHLARRGGWRYPTTRTQY